MEDSPESSNDGEFEVTAEMLIHDSLDDESTMAQDEALQTKEEDQEELMGLQDEGSMPLEQLLSLYGYNSSQQAGPSSSSLLEARSNVAQMDSNSGGSRSRRKRGRPNEASSAEADSADSSVGPIAPPSLRNRLGSNSKEDVKTEGLTCKSLSVDVRSYQSMPNRTQKDVQQSSVRMDSGDIKIRDAPKQGGRSSDQGGVSSGADRLKGGGRRILDEVFQLSDPDTEDSTDVEVVEDDGLVVGLEADLREEDHTLLHLAQLEEDVVQMGDIEAGLGKGEGLFQPLDLMCKESLEGAASRDGELEYEGGSWADSDAVEEGVGVDDQWRSGEVGGGAGVEGVGGAREVMEEGDEVEDECAGSGAMYGDALLSEATAGAPEDSDSVEDLQPVPDNSSANAKYIRGSRLRPEIPERRSMRLMNIDERVLLNNYFSSLLSDGSGSESDEEYAPQEDWKRDVKVGMDHQAAIPDFSPSTPDLMASKTLDHLIWTPMGITDRDVSEYLGALSTVMDGVSSDSSRDHEKGLEVLASCNHNSQKALKVMLAKRNQQAVPSPWTEEECKAFEEGLKAIGKDFFMLHRKVPSRSVKELVGFYYMWKKSQRYDHFIQKHGKIGRRKILVSPGNVSDFMDKYLDMHSSDAVDTHYLTTTIAAEAKKENY